MVERWVAKWGDRAWVGFVARWLAVALALHILAAVYSSGFQNADEHFQILEFLSYRLGKSPAADLSIEFHKMIRPWIQPALYLLPTEFLRLLGTENPFVWALSYRLLSSFIGWLSLAGLCFCLPRWIPDEKWKRIGVILLCLTWYMPALHARHASENLSGSFFVLGLCGLALSADIPDSWRVDLPAGPLLLSGFLLGLAFEFRYQVGIMVAGSLLWLHRIARANRRNLKMVLGGIALAIALGTGIDRWGYGRWTFAPLRYFLYNFGEAKLLFHDTYPFWDYFRRMFTESLPPLAFIYLIGILIGAYRNPRHPLAWSLIPFFLIHCAIGHKETRFLFPMAHAAPVLLLLAVYAPESGRYRFEGLMANGKARLAIYAFAAMDIAALVALSLTPAWMQEGVYAEIYRESRSGLKDLDYIERDPYVLSGIAMHFYRPPGLALTRYSNAAVFLADLKTRLKTRLKTHPGVGRELIYYRSTFAPDAPELDRLCRPIETTLPLWVQKTSAKRWLRNVSDWTLFECSGP